MSENGYLEKQQRHGGECPERGAKCVSHGFIEIERKLTHEDEKNMKTSTEKEVSRNTM